MMDLTAGTEPYSPFWPVVTFFAVFVLFGAMMTWFGFLFERNKEKTHEDKNPAYYDYKMFDKADYVMFAFVAVCLALIATIPAGAISQNEWEQHKSTDAALVREAERVYDVKLSFGEASLLLTGMVVEVEEDEFLKLDEDILVRVDSFSPLD